MPRTGAIESLPTTRRVIITRLKLSPAGMRAEELARQLGLSITAVRQQLAALASAGLASRREVRSGVGRPKLYFDAAPAADELFADASADLGAALLARLERAVPDAVWRAMLDLGEDVVRTRRTEGEQRPQGDAQSVASLLESWGALVSLSSREGRDEVVVVHCPVLHLASRCSAICAGELVIFKEVAASPQVSRSQHLLAGDSACIFELVPEDS